jgi:hypothetical protein
MSEDLEKLTLRDMKRHFKVKANGAVDLKLEIRGAGQGKETMWMRFKFASADSIEQIKVEHRMLFGTRRRSLRSLDGAAQVHARYGKHLGAADRVQHWNRVRPGFLIGVTIPVIWGLRKTGRWEDLVSEFSRIIAAVGVFLVISRAWEL